MSMQHRHSSGFVMHSREQLEHLHLNEDEIKERVLMGVPNYQLTTNFSANCQLTTIFLANCQLTTNFSYLLTFIISQR